MKKSNLLFLTLFMLPVICSAQQVTMLYPTSNPTGLNWTELTAESDTFFIFLLPRTSINTNYSGVVQAVAYIDTAAAGVEDSDSLTISIEPLYFDKVENALVRSSAADRDSVDIVNLYDWGATDADSTYDISAIADLPPCQGARVNVYAGLSAACRIRVELHISRPYGY